MKIFPESKNSRIISYTLYSNMTCCCSVGTLYMKLEFYTFFNFFCTHRLSVRHINMNLSKTEFTNQPDQEFFFFCRNRMFFVFQSTHPLVVQFTHRKYHFYATCTSGGGGYFFGIQECLGIPAARHTSCLHDKLPLCAPAIRRTPLAGAPFGRAYGMPWQCYIRWGIDTRH